MVRIALTPAAFEALPKRFQLGGAARRKKPARRSNKQEGNAHNVERICKDPFGDVRYAHYDCYLDAGKRLGDLDDRQVLRFPLDLLKKRGPLDEWCAAAQRELKRCHTALEGQKAASQKLWSEL
jgi:hypothetical protein